MNIAPGMLGDVDFDKFVIEFAKDRRFAASLVRAKGFLGDLDFAADYEKFAAEMDASFRLFGMSGLVAAAWTSVWLAGKKHTGRVVTDNSGMLVNALRKIVTLEDLVAKLLAAKVADEDLTEEQEMEIIQQHSSKDEWPEDGVSVDFMPFLRWGVHIGIRHQCSKLIPVTEIPHE